MRETEPISPDSSWYAETAVPAPERPQLTFDLDVDVCIIGAGLAGLTTAREVARRGWSVAVLEARHIAFGASGRNSGFVLPGFAEDTEGIVERVGLQHAKALWALSERGAEYVRKTIRETKMPGVKPVDGWLWVSKFHDDPAATASVTLLRDAFGAKVEAWPGDKVRTVLRSPLYHNAIHFPRAFHIHALNYARGLAAAAEKAGARIFEHTPALTIDPAGVRKRVATPSARVRASHIVLAGNTGLGALMPRIAASLVPITTYVAVTAPLRARLAEAVAYKGGVSDTLLADNHYRIVDGDRLMWSGGATTWVSRAGRFVHRLARDMQRTFPQLGDVAIEHIWSGTLGRPVHNMPQVGEISRGLWLASGFGGHGFNTTAMAGELIARGIVEGDQTWRLFAPYDLVWAGGAFGRAAVQVMYWSTRIGDLVKARLAGAKAIPAAEPEAAGVPAATEASEIPASAPSVTAEAPTPAESKPTATKSGKKRRKAAKKARRKKAAVARKRPAAAAQPLAASGEAVQNSEDPRGEKVAVER